MDDQPSRAPGPGRSRTAFTPAGALAGFIAVLPIIPVALVLAALFGVLAGEKGIGTGLTILMSATVFAGAAQYASLELWGTPLPAGPIIALVLAINARHVLLGATLAPWTLGLSPARAHLTMFFMVDEVWALSMARMRAGGSDAAFLVGAGLGLWVSWTGATAAGRIAGALVRDPAAWGIDVVGTIFFMSMLSLFWRGRGDIVPWAVAAAAAILAERLLPGGWSVMLGGIAGGLVGAARR
jgi:predicted branched-subunit amino acid permease